MAQINLYFKDGDPLVRNLQTAAEEFGLSSNELAIRVLEMHLDDYCEMSRRLALAREAELTRLTAEGRVRDQRALNEQVRGTIRGAGFLINAAYTRAHGLELDVSDLKSPLLDDARLRGDARLRELLEPILTPFDGYLISQEQLMAIALEVGDFSLEEADSLRKAGAKLRHDKIASLGKKFLAGAATRGVSREAAQFLYGAMMYGDPEASVAFEEYQVAAAAPKVLYGMTQTTRRPILRSPWNDDGTVQITTVMGQPGSGKSFWLRCQLVRQAALGTRIIAIDPVDDFGGWFTRNEGQVIDINSDSAWHHNPLKVAREQRLNSLGEAEIAYENIDVKINQRLKPLFRLLLGLEYSGLADGLIGYGLRAFYDRYGNEDEHVMGDFVELLRELNTRNEEQLSPSSIDERRRLIDNLKLKLIDGEFRAYFAHKSNMDLSSRKLCFSLSRSRGGLQQALAAYIAVDAAVDAACSSHERKLLLVDEVHRLFGDTEAPVAMEMILDDLFRAHRHWNTAIMMAAQWSRDDPVNKSQASLLASTNTWILMRDSERGLKQTLEQLSPGIDSNMLLPYLVSDRRDIQQEIQDRPAPRRAMLVEDGRLTPLLSVALGSEDELLGIDLL
jgi:hypothetical protein